jgi:lipopolysaccharide transport protein LptA
VNKILNLDTAVTLETDDGYECKTTHARIFPREKRVEGDKPIDCNGTFGSVKGQAYEINDNYREFVFKDNMSAVINQDPAQKPEIDPEATEVQNEFAFGGDGPINVKANRAVYIGGTTDLFDNVEVIQDGAIINAQEMTILRREATSDVDGTLRLGEVNKITAKRDFRYRTTENDITGNQGVYERDKSLITVTGDVRVKQTGGNTARTDRLTYNTVTETIRFSGNCQGPGCGREGSTRVVISGN